MPGVFSEICYCSPVIKCYYCQIMMIGKFATEYL